MIPRTTLPNLANQFSKEKPPLHHIQQMRRSQINHQSKRFNQKSNMYLTQKQNRNKLNKFNTQPAFNSQTGTLQMKQFYSPDEFHHHHNTRTKSLIQTNTVAPYFFKILNSHKILQNSDELKRKMTQARKQQTQRLRMVTIEQSKKSHRKLISSLQKTATQSVGTLTDRLRNDSFHPQQQLFISSNYPTAIKLIDQSKLTSLSQTIQNRKYQLTQNAKQARYTFEHFNSGEIFTEIALINQNNRLLADDVVYRMGGSLLKNRKKSYLIRKQMQESFRDQYNAFLRSKLPSSFGQNGNKACIYEQYVLKRRQQQKRALQSKLIQGKFLRTQPTPSTQQDFIFTNDISVISAKKIKIQQAFAEKVGFQESKQQTRQDFSATTSKIVTHTNTKNNTLRQGQTFINKLKLKKLVKQSQKEKPKILNKNNQSLKSRTYSRVTNSSISDYENTLSQAEMNKFLQKANLILGRSPVVNPQVQSLHFENSPIQQFPQNHQQNILMNEYQQQHLAHVDRLLCKQQTILRKDKQDLDSLPWRISIKVSKQSNL